MYHKCLSCGKVITWQFAICSKCEKIHGSRTNQWPTWLRFLWGDTQKDRRRAKRIAKHEVPLADILQAGETDTDTDTY